MLNLSKIFRNSVNLAPRTETSQLLNSSLLTKNFNRISMSNINIPSRSSAKGTPCCAPGSACCPPQSQSNVKPNVATPKPTDSVRSGSSISTSTTATDYNSSVKQDVAEYYGKVLQSTKDLKTSACCTAEAPPLAIRSAISKIPSEVLDKYYGCGSPMPTGGITGLNILDLGSGSGRDSYIMASLVGEKGNVYGIDMTDEQLDVARRNADAYCKNALKYSRTNLEFKKGFIEDIKGAGIKDESIDMVISNCVVNLSPDKPAVIKGVFNALREGGEFYFSDVYCDRRLPQHVRDHKVLWGECISGALYIEDFKRICHEVGFKDVRKLGISSIEVNDPKLKDILGEAKFYSITYRCFKVKDMETLCEDYGQVGIYRGTIPGSPNSYVLDDHHKFEKGRPMLVCGNTASMVGETWLKPHFQVMGDRSVHYGLFAGCYTDWNENEIKSTSSSEPGLSGGCC